MTRADTDKDSDKPAQLHGRIAASHGQRGHVELADGELSRFVLKGRELRVVCGDAVICEPQADSPELLVTRRQPRRNALERPSGRGRTEVLAANLDTLVVVTAPRPAPDCFLLDRFLCAAELIGAGAVLVINKADLDGMEDHPDIAEYRRLGYPLLHTSAVTGDGMTELADQLNEGTSVLVGQSGVGKSSLINYLVPNAAALTGELSRASGDGRHTTTASCMFELPGGGRLIDSPGVREYAPAINTEAGVQAGFREILRKADNCRFANCQHTREPDCAVKAAVDDGVIAERRYASYKRLRNMHAAVSRPTRH